MHSDGSYKYVAFCTKCSFFAKWTFATTQLSKMLSVSTFFGVDSPLYLLLRAPL